MYTEIEICTSQPTIPYDKEAEKSEHSEGSREKTRSDNSEFEHKYDYQRTTAFLTAVSEQFKWIGSAI